VKHKDSSNGQIAPADILDEVEELQDPKSNFPVSDSLSKVLETSEKLRVAKSGEIKFAAPIINHFGKPIIFPNTINVIQGQAGSHKSRLAENKCSALMKTPKCYNTLLSFEKVDPLYNAIVVYVDSERNTSDQLPYALQSIQTKAGYEKSDNPSNFKFISLLEIPRKDRFKTLNDYINYLRNSTDRPLFIVLDVSTDCLEDFNKVDKSMELIDLLNVTINQFDVTFLCLIHENPGSDKARGHFGTELMNKASTVMQVRFEKDAQNNDTDLIKVKYLKCRSTERYSPFYIRYCKEDRGLVLASDLEIQTAFDSKKTKANTEAITDFLGNVFAEKASLRRSEILEIIMDKFSIGKRTAEDRLKEIIENEVEVFNADGVVCNLCKVKSGREITYTLNGV
jgi:hypothetical protein